MGNWTCGACGGPNPHASRFCGQCGGPRELPGEPDTGAWSCRSCGMRNGTAFAYCGGCGGRRPVSRQEESRLVTALFVDISGFTSLAEELDTEELHEVVTPLVGALTRIAEQYGGFVEKFAGDALLAVFGTPVTHEDDPQRALLAAIEMHERLPALLARLGPKAAHLALHAGVNTGRVIGRQMGSLQQSDYAVLGDSVILAQRLESVCPPGQTYVGAATHAACSAEFDFDLLPPLTLKGKREPVVAHRLIGRRTRPSRASRPLVARSTELHHLVEDLGRPGALVALRGEPGVGKSRLVAALVDRVARDVTVLPARCLSYGNGLPYWPFADLLRRALPADDLRDGVSRLLPEPARAGALALLGTEVDAPSPQAARRAVHEAVVTWLGQETARRAVLLVVEDVHWIDPPSADLLREVALRVTDLRVLLTCRYGGEVPLPDGARGRTIDLSPLDRAAVQELARSVLPAPPGPVLSDVLIARTGGNPLFVEQLAHALAESGELVVGATTCELPPGAATDAVPATVEQVLATRVDRLPPAASGLLQVASVIGRVVPLGLLRAVAGDDAMAELPSLLDAGMLVRTGHDRVAFHHALLQDVVESRLLRRRSRELHRRVAEVARELHGDTDDSVGLVARHLYLGGAGLEAVQALERAGRRAAALHANDDAALHLSRAVEVLRGLPGAEPPADLLLQLAAVHEVRGAYDDALHLYREVRLRTGAVAAWRGELAVLRARGQYEQALELWEQSGLTSPELVLEGGTTLLNSGRHAEAVGVLQGCLAGALDPGLRVRVLGQLARALKLASRLDEALTAAQAAVTEARQAGDVREEGTALRMLGDVLVGLRRLDEAEAAWTAALGAARRVGVVDEEAGLLLNLGFLELERGDPAAALVHNERAVSAFERVGHGSGTAIGYGNLAWTVLQLGRPEESLEWCDRADRQATAIGHLGTLADVAKTRGFALAATGRAEAAATALREAAELFDRLGVADERDACLRMAQTGVPVRAGS